LAPSTVEILVKNIKKGVSEARVFELANVYLPKELPIENFPTERITLSLGMYGKSEDFYSLKGSIEALAGAVGKELKFEAVEKAYLHPTRSASIIMDGEVVGVMGQIRYEITETLTVGNEIFVAEIDFDKFMRLANFEYAYKNISKHPAIKRDLALVVHEETTTGEVEEIIKQTGKKVSKIELFDVYQGEQVQVGFKSFAYHITFSADENPITHEEVDSSIKKILYRLNEKLGVVIRN
ncbi:MAG: phenylalanine--tRNA ligase subunit beta, partial [Clostridia bacterium]|nr:phenylalanine--tRNA ligase subunit beta [Clostridia bacterium]